MSCGPESRVLLSQIGPLSSPAAPPLITGGRTRFLPPSRRALVTPIPRSRTHFQKSSSLERVRRQGNTPLHHTHERAHISCHCTPCTYMPLFFPSSISTGPEEHHPSSGDHMPQQVYSSASESETPWASLAN